MVLTRKTVASLQTGVLYRNREKDM